MCSSDLTHVVVVRQYATFSAVLFFKQKTAYEMRISDWSSDVCSSDLLVGDPERTARSVIGDAHGAAARLSVLDEAGHEVLWLAGGPPVREGDEADLVAREALAVPAAMLANERALREAGEAGAIRENEAERCDVRAQRVIGGDRKSKR